MIIQKVQKSTQKLFVQFHYFKLFMYVYITYNEKKESNILGHLLLITIIFWTVWCSELGIFMYWTCNSINNLSSYCGLVDAKIRASDKDLPVQLDYMELEIHLSLCSMMENVGCVQGKSIITKKLLPVFFLTLFFEKEN